MANTKTKTLSKTLICRILKENCNDFWKNIFIVGDFCYFTNGKQMVRCDSSFLDLSGTDVDLINIEDMSEKDKNTIMNMVKIFDNTLTEIGKVHISANCYRINKSALKNAITNKRKEIKDMNFGMVGKTALVSVTFKKTVVNAKYLSELIQLNKEKSLNVYVDDNEPLNPIVVGDESDNIISILCPLREGYKPGIIDTTTILEV